MKSYKALVAILSFYLLAQLFQQYVLQFGPLAGVAGLEQSIIAGQHPLNFTRHVLILFSMFLMVPGFLILGLYFYKQNPVAAVLAIIFFTFFCLLEISYRSLHFFQVMTVWGKTFAEGDAAARAEMLPRFQDFYGMVNAIYFPLLSCLLLGSVFLMACTIKVSPAWPVTVGLAIKAIQQLSRLAGYTALDFLNVFSGIWYFVLVLISFGLIIYWAVKNKPELKVFHH